MKAIVYTRYGPPEVLHLDEVAKPVPTDDEVLIKVQAVSLNRSDWEGLIGKPLYARFGGLFTTHPPSAFIEECKVRKLAFSAHTSSAGTLGRLVTVCAHHTCSVVE